MPDSPLPSPSADPSASAIHININLDSSDVNIVVTGKRISSSVVGLSNVASKRIPPAEGREGEEEGTGTSTGYASCCAEARRIAALASDTDLVSVTINEDEITEAHIFPIVDLAAATTTIDDSPWGGHTPVATISILSAVLKLATETLSTTSARVLLHAWYDWLCLGEAKVADRMVCSTNGGRTMTCVNLLQKNEAIKLFLKFGSVI